MATRYWLSRDCYFCTVGDALVFLDARNSVYFTLATGDARALGDWVHGWHEVDGAAPEASSGGELPQVVEELLARKLLVLEPNEGKPAQATSVKRASEALLADYEQLDVKPSLWETIQFARAATSALSLQRLPTLAAIARRLERGSECLENRDREITPPDLQTMKRAQAVFRHLLPYLWRPRARARFELLVLIKFFEYQGFYPRWVIGVSLNPFARHTWLQIHGFVIDSPPFLSSVPIMVIR